MSCVIPGMQRTPFRNNQVSRTSPGETDTTPLFCRALWPRVPAQKSTRDRPWRARDESSTPAPRPHDATKVESDAARATTKDGDGATTFGSSGRLAPSHQRSLVWLLAPSAHPLATSCSAHWPAPTHRKKRTRGEIYSAILIWAPTHLQLLLLFPSTPDPSPLTAPLLRNVPNH
jgi:hypothetical protein